MHKSTLYSGRKAISESTIGCSKIIHWPSGLAKFLPALICLPVAVPAFSAADPNLYYSSAVSYTIGDADLERTPVAINQFGTVWENSSVSISGSWGTATVSGAANFEDATLKLAMSGTSDRSYTSYGSSYAKINDRITIIGNLDEKIVGYIITNVHGSVAGTTDTDYWHSMSSASANIQTSNPFGGGVDNFSSIYSTSGYYNEILKVPFYVGGAGGINWLAFGAGLSMQFSGNWNIDFGNTMTFSIVLPDGYSYVSAGGLTFQPLNPATGGVPEPTSWAMMIVGFGLIGAVARAHKAFCLTLG
ncbi:MAG: hypothetical protein DI568_05440 [Sphingomonas sp.]|nr:MAG: hypothetical protein DI568_05440 [Sphingomonas sp.]